MKANYAGRNDVVVRKNSNSGLLILLLVALLAFNLVKGGFSFGKNTETQKEVIYVREQTNTNNNNNSNNTQTNTKPAEVKKDLEITNKMTNSGSKFTEILKPTSNVKDNFGNEYRNAYVVNTWGDPSIYVTVNSDYSYIQGSFAVQKKQAEVFNHFVVYAYDEDGTEIYKSQTLYADDPEGLFISIPISGCRTVRIKFSGCDRCFNSVDVICTGLYFSNQR